MKEWIQDIATKDGAMETFICHPERGGPYPPILFLMDAPGIRGELYEMVRRLATVGCTSSSSTASASASRLPKAACAC